MDSNRSLQFLPESEQDPESEFRIKTGSGAEAGVDFSVFTGAG